MTQESRIKKFMLYGRRKGHPLHKHKQVLMETLFAKMQIDRDLPDVIDIHKIFYDEDEKKYDKHDVYLEIGFGGGEHLAAVAKENPDINFIGCEPFVNGVASLVEHIETHQLSNIRIYDHDARLFLEALPAASIARAYVLFADPWPKARHHKRRIINHETLAELHRILESGAQLRIASDDPSYLEWIEEHLAETPHFTPLAGHDVNVQPGDWPRTRYQEKAVREGRACKFFIMIRNV